MINPKSSQFLTEPLISEVETLMECVVVVLDPSLKVSKLLVKFQVQVTMLLRECAEESVLSLTVLKQDFESLYDTDRNVVPVVWLNE